MFLCCCRIIYVRLLHTLIAIYGFSFKIRDMLCTQASYSPTVLYARQRIRGARVEQHDPAFGQQGCVSAGDLSPLSSRRGFMPNNHANGCLASARAKQGCCNLANIRYFDGGKPIHGLRWWGLLPWGLAICSDKNACAYHGMPQTSPCPKPFGVLACQVYYHLICIRWSLMIFGTLPRYGGKTIGTISLPIINSLGSYLR